VTLVRGEGNESDPVQWENSHFRRYITVSEKLENAVVRKVSPFQGGTVVFRRKSGTVRNGRKQPFLGPFRSEI
jgi:hypothetical protein